MNREFIRDQERRNETPKIDEALIARNSTRRLDDWYRGLNRTYWNRNFDRDASSIFSHLVEVIGGLSALASGKKKPGVDAEAHTAKVLAWWMALCGKVGVTSVEAMIWDKFPAVCPYCHRRPHDPDLCSERKALVEGPDWGALSQLGVEKERPSRIREWQRMFSSIYPVQQIEEYGPSFARLAEELGELAEAVRVFRAQPGYFLSEAADVFAWFMHIQNILDRKNNVSAEKRGDALERALSTTYPDGCAECNKRICVCQPILPSTIGRIAHEVPLGRGSFDAARGQFMTPDRASAFFQDE